MQEIVDFFSRNIWTIAGFLGFGTLAGAEARYRWLRGFLARVNAEPFLDSVPLKILIAPLLHDKDDRQTGHIVEVLRAHLKAGEPQGHCDYKVLPEPLTGKSFASGSTEEQRIAGRIQDRLARYNADIMIWGHVVKDDQTLHLSVTPRRSEAHHGNR